MRLTVPRLQPGREYVIQIRESDGKGKKSAWSPAFEFTTDDDNIVPSTPSDVTWTISGDAFHAKWEPVTTNTAGDPSVVARYEVEIAAIDGGLNIIKSIAVPQKSGGTITWSLSSEENRAIFGALYSNINFKVRAVDVKDLKSAWSSTLNVNRPLPGAPSNVVASAGTNQITLNWNPSPTKVSGYNVYSQANALLAFVNATTYTYYTSTYSAQSLQVAAVDAFGKESVKVSSNAVTPISPFVADTTPPNVPVISSAVIANITGGRSANMKVSWTLASAPADLAGFQIRYKKTAETFWSQTSATKEDRSVSIDFLEPYVSYHVQARSVDKSLNYSAWTASTTANPPANAAPGNVTGLSASPGNEAITYSWDLLATDDIKNYELTFSTSSTFASGNVTFLNGISNSLTVSGLSPSTTYYARVRAQDEGGLYSAAWSSTISSTTSAPFVTELSDGVAPTSSPTPTLKGGIGYLHASWSPVANADPVTYEVYLGTTSGFSRTENNKVGETPATNINILSTTNNPTLSYGTTYYVRIIAKDVDGAAPVGAEVSGQTTKATSVDLNVDPRIDFGVPDVFIQPAQPANNVSKKGDRWYDSDDNNKEYAFNGTSWVSVQDGSIAVAQTTATNAGNAASNAQVIANNAATAAAVADSKAENAIVSGSNMLTDPSFEDESRVLVSGMTYSTDFARTGTKSIKSTGNGNLALTTIPVVAGRKYKFSVWVYTDAAYNGSPGLSKLRLQGDDGAYISESSFTGAANVWREVTLTYTAIAARKSVTIQLYDAGTRSGLIYFDDARAEDVTDKTELEGSIGSAQNTADSKTKTFVQSTAPSSTTIGDIWIDTANNNLIKTSTALGTGSWVARQDGAIATAQSTANSKGKVYYQSAAPTPALTQDLWIDTTNNANTPKRYNGSAWVSVTDKAATDAASAAGAAQTAANLAQTTADGKGKIYYQTTAPSPALTQDLWIDTTSNANTPKRYNGTAWVAVTDKAATDAQAAATAAQTSANNAATAASNAQTTANSKGKIYYQTTAPTPALTQDLWIDITGGANTPKRYNGSAWVAVTDKAATDAANSANAAGLYATKGGFRIGWNEYPTIGQNNIGEIMVGGWNADGTPATDGVNGYFYDNGATITVPYGSVVTMADVAAGNGKRWLLILDTVNTTLERNPSRSSSFSNLSPNVFAVYSENGQWRYDDNGAGPVITPLPTDYVLGSFGGDGTNIINQTTFKSPPKWTEYVLAEEQAYEAATAASAAQATADSATTAASTAQTAADNANTAAANAAGIANSKAVVLYQTTAPASQFRNALTLWIDTTGGANTPKRWTTGTTWVAVTDKAATDAATAAANAQTTASNAATAATTAQNTADGKGRVYYQTVAPSPANQQDLWVDTNGGANTPKRYNGTAWVAVTDKVATDAAAAASAAQGTANSALTAAQSNSRVYYQTTAPSSTNSQDLWIDTTGGNNTPKRYNGSAWVTVTDKAATDAATLAAGKGTIYFQTTAPASILSQDLWIDTSGNANTPRRYNGTSWVAVTDKTATDAAALASAANTTANNPGTSRNLLTKSKTFANQGGYYQWLTAGGANTIVTGTIPYLDQSQNPVNGNLIRITATTASSVFRIREIREIGTYTFSFWGKSNTASDQSIFIDINDEDSTAFTLTPVWKRFKATVTTTRYSSTYNFIDIQNSAANVDVLIYEPMLEKGMTASAYVPSVEETEASISSAQTKADDAFGTATGKNKVIWSTNNASGTSGYVAGDIWYKRDATDNIIAQWEYNGTAWVNRFLSDAVLSSLTVGKLVGGDISAITINMKSSGAIKSDNFAAGSTGWKLDSSGLEVNSGAIKAKALDVTLGGGNLFSNSGFDNSTNYLAQWGTGLVGTGASVTRDTGIVRFGSTASVKLQRGTNTTGGNYTLIQYSTSPISLQAGQKVTLSFWYYATRVGSRITADMNGVARLNETVAVSNTWVRFVYTMVAPTTTTYVPRIFSDGGEPSDVFYIDDVQFEEGEIATAYSPKASEILPGTISGDMIKAGTALINDLTVQSNLTVNSGGYIKSSNYNSTTGYRLGPTGLEVWSGTIKGSTIETSSLIIGQSSVTNLTSDLASKETPSGAQSKATAAQNAAISAAASDATTKVNAVAAMGPSLVQDPNMETAGSGKSFSSSNVTLITNDATAFSGSTYVRINNAESYPGVSFNISLREGRRYRVEFMVRSVDAGNHFIYSRVNLKQSDGTTNFWPAISTGTTNNEWVKRYYDFETTGKKNLQTTLWIQGNNSGGFFHVDDVNLYDITDAYNAEVAAISAAAADATTKAANAESAAISTASSDATAKSAVASVASLEASQLAKNSTFDAWTGTYPDFQGAWSQGPVKNSTDVRSGRYSMEWNISASGNYGGTGVSGAWSHIPYSRYMMVEADVMLKSGTLHGAGLYLYWGEIGSGASGNHVTTPSFNDVLFVSGVTTVVPNKWYTIRFVTQAPAPVVANPATEYTGLSGHIMANHPSCGGSAAKHIIIDRVAIRHATLDEIYANQAPADATTKANAAQNAAVATAATDATNKANDAIETALDSSNATVNANFFDWTGTVPAGFSNNVGGGLSKSSLSLTGNSIRYGLAAGDNGYMSTTTNNRVYSNYMTVEADVQLVSGSMQGAGILVDFNQATGSNTRKHVHFNPILPNPVAGTWYRVTKVVTPDSSYITPITSMRHYIMGGWTGFSGSSAEKDIVFDRVNLRPSTPEEIEAYELSKAGTRARVVDWTASDGTKIDGGRIFTGSVDTDALKANAVTANKLNVIMGGENLVPNSQAKNDISGYVVSTNAGIVAVPSRVTGVNSPTGDTAFQFSQAATSGKSWNLFMAPPHGTLVVGETYTLSFYARNISGEAVWTVRTATGDGQNSQGMTPSTFTAPATWKRFVYSFTCTSPGTTSNAFYVARVNTNAAGVSQFTGFQIERGDVATGYSPKTDEILPGTIVGNMVQTNTLEANSLKSGSVFTNTLIMGAAGTPGIIQSYDYSGSAGFKISSAGLEINSGKVSAGTLSTGAVTSSTITLGSGGILKTNNDAVQITDTGITVTSGATGGITASAITTGTFGTGNVLTVNGNMLLNGNMQVQTGGYIKSSEYAGTTYAAASPLGWYLGRDGLRISSGAVSASTLTTGNLGSSTGVIQIQAGASMVFNGGYIKSNTYTGTTATNSNGSAGFYLGNDGLTINRGTVKAEALSGGTFNAGTINIAAGGAITGTGFSLSNSGLTVTSGTISASAITITPTFSQDISNNITTIDGGKITTGEIRSTALAKTPDGSNITGVPAWSISTTGAAQFGDALVRGRITVGNPTDNTTFSAIQSGNYTAGAGGAGWRINNTGAEFNSVTVRGDIIGAVITGSDLNTRTEANLGFKIDRFNTVKSYNIYGQRNYYLHSGGLDMSGEVNFYADPSTGAGVVQFASNSQVEARGKFTFMSAQVPQFNFGLTTANLTIGSTGAITTSNTIKGNLLEASNLEGGATSISVNSSGRIIRGGSSSIRKKHSIEKISLDEAQKVLEVESVSFIMNNDHTGTRSAGVVAEQLAEIGMEKWIYRDSKGRPDGVHYDRISIAQNVVIQDMHARMERLEAALESMQDGS